MNKILNEATAQNNFKTVSELDTYLQENKILTGSITDISSDDFKKWNDLYNKSLTEIKSDPNVKYAKIELLKIKQFLMKEMSLQLLILINQCML